MWLFVCHGWTRELWGAGEGVSLTCRSLSRSALLATSTMGNSDLVGKRRRGRKKEGKKIRRETKPRTGEREREAGGTDKGEREGK